MMIPRTFDYAAPASVDEAVALLRRQPGARVLAGGHDLLTQMKLRRAAVPFLVDLRRIRDMRGITRGDGQITIGAMTTCAEIAADAAIRASAQALAEAADSIGDVQVRHCATIGGNLAYGDPAADLPAALLVLEARIHVYGPDGSREIPIDQFVLGPFATSLEPNEIITSLSIPVVTSPTGSAYEKFRNPASGYPICGVAARIGRAGTGALISTCRVAVTGATAHPRRLTALEAALENKTQIPETIAAATSRAGDGLSFVTDLAASGEYREHLTAVLAERAVSRAIERARPR